MPYAEVRPEPSEWVEARQSGVHGHGLFAAKRIPKGQAFLEYGGYKVPKRVGSALTEAQWANGHVTVFTLNKRWDLDGSPEWNIARLANHSCDPNAESQIENAKRIWIVARRTIQKGEEITYDYGFDFVNPPVPCRCGAKKCVGFLVGEEAYEELLAHLEGHQLPVPKALRLAIARKKRTSKAKRTKARLAKWAKQAKGANASKAGKNTRPRKTSAKREK